MTGRRIDKRDIVAGKRAKDLAVIIDAALVDHHWKNLRKLFARCIPHACPSGQSLLLVKINPYGLNARVGGTDQQVADDRGFTHSALWRAHNDDDTWMTLASFRWRGWINR
jgi:hypothetical protein